MEAKNPAKATGAGTAAPAKVVTLAYNFRRDGLPRIRRALLVFIITVVLCALMVGGIRFMLSKVAPQTAAAQQKQTEARDRYSQAENERVALRDFQARFEQLRTRGFFGPENRLRALDVIKAIQLKHRLLEVTYSFAPQQTVLLDPALLAPPLELHSSRVELHLKLLHELDLVHFMQDLKEQGFFTVRDCALAPSSVAAGDVRSPRMTADCTLYWLTVAEAAPLDPAALPVQ